MISLETMKRVATTIAIVIAAACALSTAEQAHVTYAAGSVQVDDSDLDLSGRSGLFALYRRLQDASMLTCDPESKARVLPLYGRPESGDCYSDTLQAALTSYENDALERIHYELQLNPVIMD